MESKLYTEILEIKKELDKKFARNTELQSKLNKTDSLNTYLFSNPPEELKKSGVEIDGLIKRVKELSSELGKLGYILNGRDYSLERIDNEKIRIESAKYGFVVQYSK